MSKFENSEAAPERSVVEAAFKERGPEDPEVLELYRRWLESREAEIDIENDPMAVIHFLVEQAELLTEAGLKQQAWDTLQDARMAAHGAGDDELFVKIEAKMDELERDNK
ncbi:MAG: hypothetical protein KGZ30_00430 [Anaplasmataceae bacterium]|nr:hypothetical protein [Anaplasmataceae bacterium]